MRYYKIQMEPDSVSLTAFHGRYGHLEFQILLFALTNASASFMDLMNKVCVSKLDKFANAFLDGL